MLHLLHSYYLYLLPKYNCLWNSNYLRFVFLPLFIFFIRDLLHTLPLDSQFTFNLLFCLVFFMAKPIKNPTTMPIKLQIKSSMSKLLPNTICNLTIKVLTQFVLYNFTRACAHFKIVTHYCSFRASP